MNSRSSVLQFVLCKAMNWNGNGKPGFEARIDPKGIGTCETNSQMKSLCLKLGSSPALPLAVLKVWRRLGSMLQVTKAMV